MDPHSTPASAYETEVEPDRARGGIAALLNAVLVTGGLWALQIMSGTAPLSTWAEKNGTNSADWAASLLGGRLTYLGNGSLGDLVSADSVVHTAILTGTVFVLTWLITRLATIGIRPRAFFPVLMGCWLAAVVATASGQIAETLYSYVSDGRSGWLLASLGDVLESGAAYGVTYGWAIGLIVALIWLAVPGKAVPVQEYTPMSTLIGGPAPGPHQAPHGGPRPGPGGAPGGYGRQMRSTLAVPSGQAGVAPSSSNRPVHPVEVRTFTGPTRANGPAGDTAAWKDFVRDVRGQS